MFRPPACSDWASDDDENEIIIPKNTIPSVWKKDDEETSSNEYGNSKDSLKDPTPFESKNKTSKKEGGNGNGNWKQGNKFMKMEMKQHDVKGGMEYDEKKKDGKDGKIMSGYEHGQHGGHGGQNKKEYGNERGSSRNDNRQHATRNEYGNERDNRQHASRHEYGNDRGSSRQHASRHEYENERGTSSQDIRSSRGTSRDNRTDSSASRNMHDISDRKPRASGRFAPAKLEEERIVRMKNENERNTDRHGTDRHNDGPRYATDRHNTGASRHNDRHHGSDTGARPGTDQHHHATDRHGTDRNNNVHTRSHTPSPSHMGIITSMKESFGFISSLTLEDLFFHISQAPSHITVNTEVEFRIGENKRTGKECALDLQILKKGSVKMEEEEDGIFRGRIKKGLSRFGEGSGLIMLMDDVEEKEEDGMKEKKIDGNDVVMLKTDIVKEHDGNEQHADKNGSILKKQDGHDDVVVKSNDDGDEKDHENDNVVKSNDSILNKQHDEKDAFISKKDDKDASMLKKNQKSKSKTITFTPSSISSSSPLPHISDIVSFKISTHLKTGARRAINVTILETAKQQRHTTINTLLKELNEGDKQGGRIVRLRSNQGEIECASCEKTMVFSSEDLSDKMSNFRVGDEVTFYILKDVAGNLGFEGEERAFDVKKVKKGTIVFEEVLMEQVEGVVTKVAREGRLGELRYDMSVIEDDGTVADTDITDLANTVSDTVSDVAVTASKEKGTLDVTVSLNKETLDDTVLEERTAALTLKEASTTTSIVSTATTVLPFDLRDVQTNQPPPTLGDTVFFTLYQSKRNMKLFTRKISITSFNPIGRETGVIKTFKNEYGFITCADHYEDAYFHQNAFVVIGQDMKLSKEESLITQDVKRFNGQQSLTRQEMKPYKGQTVEFLLVKDKDRLSAKKIIILNDDSITWEMEIEKGCKGIITRIPEKNTRAQALSGLPVQQGIITISTSSVEDLWVKKVNPSVLNMVKIFEKKKTAQELKIRDILSKCEQDLLEVYCTSHDMILKREGLFGKEGRVTIFKNKKKLSKVSSESGKSSEESAIGSSESCESQSDSAKVVSSKSSGQSESGKSAKGQSEESVKSSNVVSTESKESMQSSTKRSSYRSDRFQKGSSSQPISNKDHDHPPIKNNDPFELQVSYTTSDLPSSYTPTVSDSISCTLLFSRKTRTLSIASLTFLSAVEVQVEVGVVMSIKEQFAFIFSLTSHQSIYVPRFSFPKKDNGNLDVGIKTDNGFTQGAHVELQVEQNSNLTKGKHPQGKNVKLLKRNDSLILKEGQDFLGFVKHLPKNTSQSSHGKGLYGVIEYENKEVNKIKEVNKEEVNKEEEDEELVKKTATFTIHNVMKDDKKKQKLNVGDIVTFTLFTSLLPKTSDVAKKIHFVKSNSRSGIVTIFDKDTGTGTLKVQETPSLIGQELKPLMVEEEYTFTSTDIMTSHGTRRMNGRVLMEVGDEVEFIPKGETAICIRLSFAPNPLTMKPLVEKTRINFNASLKKQMEGNGNNVIRKAKGPCGKGFVTGWRTLIGAKEEEIVVIGGEKEETKGIITSVISTVIDTSTKEDLKVDDVAVESSNSSPLRNEAATAEISGNL